MGCRIPQLAIVLSSVLAGCGGASQTDAGGEADASISDVGTEDAGGPSGDASSADGGGDSRDTGDDGTITQLLSGEDVALAATSVEFTADRVCDLDGDGMADNAVAELGGTELIGVTMLLDTLASGALERGYGPGLFFPVIVDGGDSTLIALAGDGTSLGGGLRAPYESMDGCGEPRFVYQGPMLAAGVLGLEVRDFPVSIGDAVVTGGARLSGPVERGSDGIWAELEECMAVQIRRLGGARGPLQARGRSLLETVVGGGQALGMAGVPGLSPDLDLDGDGLERVLLGDDGHVRACVDGDLSVISGSDCWRDRRIADAFSLTRRVRYEETIFVGRVHGWIGYCEEGYPSPSLFGEEWAVAGDYQLSVGAHHGCRRDPDGSIRCWGSGNVGQLGYGNTESLGDDEPACAGGVVDLGEGALSVMASVNLSCAILAERRLRCWGDVGAGLPLIGDDETPAEGTDVDLGAAVSQIAAGRSHHCALLSGGRVRCWGSGANGRLGLGRIGDIPADAAADAPDLQVGGRVAALTAGFSHTCALLLDGTVRCWGEGAGGRLGYGDEEDVGDDETPAEAGPVDLGGTVVAIDAGLSHTCALMADGGLRCWGEGLDGRLGYGTEENLGDDEVPAAAGDVPLGLEAVAVTAGVRHSCAVVAGGDVYCWGLGEGGLLGYGNTLTLGDDELPGRSGPVDIGAPAVDVAAGALHTCALLPGGAVRCWGEGGQGALGYGNAENIGDDETPASAGDVPVVCD